MHTTFCRNESIQLPIQEHAVEKFEKDVERGKTARFESFLAEVCENTQYTIAFQGASLRSRLLQLLSKTSLLPPAQEKIEALFNERSSVFDVNTKKRTLSCSEERYENSECSPKELANRYLYSRGITYQITKNGKYSILLSDFMTLFNDCRKDKILKLLAREIDEVCVNCCEIAALYVIPSSYRNGIISITGLDEFTGSLEQLFSLLPNSVENHLDHKMAENLLHSIAKASSPLAIECRKLGIACQREGMFDQSVIHLREAIKHNPKLASAQERLGTVLWQKGCLDKAEPFLRRAIKLHPKLPLAYTTLGDLLRQQRRFEEAKRILQKNIKLNPADAVPYGILSDVFRMLGELDKAEETAKKSIELNPKFALPFEVLGNLLLEKGQIDEAEEAFCIVLNLKESSSVAYEGLGEIYEIKEKLYKAEVMWQKAVELRPDDASTQEAYAGVLIDNEKFDLAMKVLVKATQIAPTRALPYIMMGELLRRNDRFDEAENRVLQALEIDPHDQDALELLEMIRSEQK